MLTCLFEAGEFKGHEVSDLVDAQGPVSPCLRDGYASFVGKPGGGLPFGDGDRFALAGVGEAEFGGDAVGAVDADAQQLAVVPGPQVGGQWQAGDGSAWKPSRSAQAQVQSVRSGWISDHGRRPWAISQAVKVAVSVVAS